MFDPQRSIADIVLEHSVCAQVFQRHRIDFCCRGDLSLEAAARDKGIELGALVEQLSRAVAGRRGDPALDPRELSTPRLVEHIVANHHGYLRGALPFVRSLASKVSRVHGDHNPRLRDLERTVEELAETLTSHLDMEERSLFPQLMAGNARAAPSPKFEEMMDDHHHVALLLEHVRAATDDFGLPDWACNSYRTLFSELRQLETDVFVHVHLENHVLRPRFSEA